MTRFRGTDDVDTYTLVAGKRDIVSTGGSDDQVYTDVASFGPKDRLNGGTGRDTLFLVDGGDFIVGNGHVKGFETLYMKGAGDFTLTIDNTVVGKGGTLTVNISSAIFDPVHPSSLRFDGSAERNAVLNIWASNGDDVLVAGGGNDLFHGQLGDDLMTGGRGADTYYFSGNYDAGDWWGNDVITDFKAGQDKIWMSAYGSDPVRGVDELADLIFTDTARGVVISTANETANSITLLGVSVAELDAGDFIFHGLHGAIPPQLEVPGSGAIG